MKQFSSTRENTDHIMSMESQTRPPWRSPVPYLFGGLAAMLGLIVFALLLLACSYWKLSRHQNDDGEKQKEFGEKVEAKILEEKILVIMAGQNKPTFLATPKSCVNCANVENREGQNREFRVIDEVSSEENH